jgi:hypothetical protein
LRDFALIRFSFNGVQGVIAGVDSVMAFGAINGPKYSRDFDFV